MGDSVLRSYSPLYYDHIRTDKDILKNGWRRSGITKAIKKNTHQEDHLKTRLY